MKAFAASLKERVASPPGNGPLRDFPFYFKPGVTWTHTTALGLNARLMPKGFICNVEAMAAYPNSGGSNESDIFLVLALLNSKIANFVVNQLNPTIHYGSREIGALPLPKTEKVDDQEIYELVSRAISLAKADSQEDEATYDFIAPPTWVTGLKDVTARAATLVEVECQLDEEVYRLYGINDRDRAAIEAELAEPALTAASDEEDLTDNEDEEKTEPPVSLTCEELAHRWVSYAVGIVLGRFEPGIEGALGCAIVEDENGEKRHLFSPEVEEALRQLADNDGVAVLDPTHEDDLPRKVEQALLLMLGEEQTGEVITTIGGDAHSSETSLRLFLERDFFTKVYLKWYQKRPVYWLLQSPRKTYSLYLYHERVTRDTLPLIRGSRYLEGKINQTLHRMKEMRDAAKTAEGRNKRKLEKDIEALQTQLSDLEAFDQALQRVLSAHNERGEIVGWAPELDDGVILNLAPLHELIPSWKSEPKKYWEGLANGDYDWSHTAMRYWPNRVLANCRKNKSYAIAHDRLDVYEGDRR